MGEQHPGQIDFTKAVIEVGTGLFPDHLQQLTVAVGGVQTRLVQPAELQFEALLHVLIQIG